MLFRSVSRELGIRAELLAKGGPRMWEEFMAELRERHLGTPRRRSAGPSVTTKLQAAYERVVARQKKKPTRSFAKMPFTVMPAKAGIQGK